MRLLDLFKKHSGPGTLPERHRTVNISPASSKEPVFIKPDEAAEEKEDTKDTQDLQTNPQEQKASEAVNDTQPGEEEIGPFISRGIQKFKMDMFKKFPFYGDFLLQIPITEDRSVSTACTDGRTIRYNPFFFKKKTEGERNYIILHEVLHVMLLHWKRQAGKDSRLWNVACDYSVNGIIDGMLRDIKNRNIAIDRPEDALVDYYKKGAAENIYYMLTSEARVDNNSVKVPVGSRYSVNRVYKEVSNIASDLIMSDSPGDDNEGVLQESRIRQMIREGIKKSYSTIGAYPVPDQFVQLVASKKLPWDRLLKDYMTDKMSDESSYLTPERKYIHMDLIIPGLGHTDEEIGEIWAFIDDSGSIATGELNQFITQLYRISKEFGAVMNIAYWNTGIDAIYKNVKNANDIVKCKPSRTGGTDISCVYKYIEDNKIKPEVMLVLTDGYFAEPRVAPGKQLVRKTIVVLSSELSNERYQKVVEKLGKVTSL